MSWYQMPGLFTRVSRRDLLRGAGAAGAGFAIGPALATPVLADDDNDSQNQNGGGNDASSIFSIADSPNEIEHVNQVLVGAFGNKGHFFFPGPVEGIAAGTDPEGAHPGGRDPSVIYDFNGVIGQADLHLTGTGTNLHTGAQGHYNFHTDMRFMKGQFVGTDGRTHRGAFAFI